MNALYWLWDNRQWLFSGLGIAVISAIIVLGRRYRSRHQPVSNVEEQLVSNVKEHNKVTSAVTIYQGRMLVGVPSDYLTGLFREHTSMQAQKLVESYIGKWMKVSGLLDDIIDSPSVDMAQVTLKPLPSAGVKLLPSAHMNLFMHFRGEELRDRLSVLRRGDHIKVLVPCVS